MSVLYSKRFFERNKISVDVGEQGKADFIVLTFGTLKVELHYSTALKFGTWIRQAAAIAKLNAGDTGKTITVVGTLSDARDSFKKGAGWS